jgi:hypothetical protein
VTHNASRFTTFGAIVGSIMCFAIYAQRPALAQPPPPTSTTQPQVPAPGPQPGQSTAQTQLAVPDMTTCPPGLSESDRAMAIMLLNRVRALADAALTDNLNPESGKPESKPTGTSGKVGDKAGKVKVRRDVLDEIAAHASQLKVMLQPTAKR